MNALILAPHGLADLELVCSSYRLLEEGWRVTLATPSGQSVVGRHGYRADADTPLRELNPLEYDLLLVPGGDSPERLRLREEAVDVARTFMEEGRRVAA